MVNRVVALFFSYSKFYDYVIKTFLGKVSVVIKVYWRVITREQHSNTQKSLSKSIQKKVFLNQLRKVSYLQKIVNIYKEAKESFIEKTLQTIQVYLYLEIWTNKKELNYIQKRFNIESFRKNKQEISEKYQRKDQNLFFCTIFLRVNTSVPS